MEGLGQEEVSFHPQRTVSGLASKGAHLRMALTMAYPSDSSTAACRSQDHSVLAER